MMKSKIVTLADTNPATLRMQKDLRNIKHISLVYFRLWNYSPATVPPPVNLYIKIDQIGNARTDNLIPAYNITTGGFSGLTNKLNSQITPLHVKSLPSEWNGGSWSQYPVWYGVQPKGMRWELHDVADLNTFTVTLYDHNLNPMSFGIQGSIYELVFEVEWCDEINQTKEWRSDRMIMNHMNG